MTALKILKERIALVALVALFCLAWLAAGSTVAIAASDFSKSGVVVTASPHWKPYSFLDERGRPAGFFIDYWNKWSEKTDIPVEFMLVAWADTIKLVADGESDIQSGLYFTDERAKTFAFSNPVFYSKGVLVTRSDIPCELDLSPYEWGGVNGTVEKEHALKYSGQPEIQGFDNSRDLFRALVDNRIQATVDDWSTVMLLGKEMGLQDKITICRTVYEKDLLGMVLKDRQDLLTVVNEGIAKITEDEKRFLVNKWFIGEKQRFDWSELGMPVAIVLLLSFFLWLLPVLRKK